MCGKNFVLGPRQVVFGNRANRFEQTRTQFIIEILGKQMFRTRRKTRAHIMRKVCMAVLFCQIVNDKSRRGNLRLRLLHLESLWPRALVDRVQAQGLRLIRGCEIIRMGYPPNKKSSPEWSGLLQKKLTPF